MVIAVFKKNYRLRLTRSLTRFSGFLFLIFWKVFQQQENKEKTQKEKEYLADSLACLVCFVRHSKRLKEKAFANSYYALC